MIEFCAENLDEFLKSLYAKQDIKYKNFNDKIVNGVGESIGIRMPDLRIIAKGIAQSEKSLAMLTLLNTQNLFEMRMIQGILIGMIKTDEDILKKLIQNFVENRINNWALCDSFTMGLKLKVRQDKAEFYEMAKRYAVSEKAWEIRFGVVMFLCYFKDKVYFEEIKRIILAITSQEHYVKMGIAWLLSVLYIEMQPETLELLKDERLDNGIRKKAIQKIKESYRVSIDDKNATATLKNQL